MKRVRLPVMLTANLAVGLSLATLTVVTWHSGWMLLTILLWWPIAFLAHAIFPMGLHEAAHCGLASSRRLNELYGILLGTALMTPLTAYRLVHWTHHRQLGSPEDLEWWPYVDPNVSKPIRQASAAAELTLGLLVTPLTILRGIFAIGRKNIGHHLPRLVAEYALVILTILALSLLLAYYGWWQEFAVFYLFPGMIAANGQSLRKFSEHLGLIGESEPELTRTVDPQWKVERLLITLALNEAYHGTHHHAPGVRWEELPDQTHALPAEDRGRTYPSYLFTVVDMLPSLMDPRFGPAWREKAKQAA